MTFVGIVIASPGRAAPVVATVWGILLLGVLTYVLSRLRREPPWRGIAKHLIVAIVVVAVSRILGGWIAAHVS
jgi:VIT1/CCC1 family predicted Fe2+/Mn2+ transporter